MELPIIMKVFRKVLLISCLTCVLVSCSAGKARDAFNSGEVKVGSTYQEMVDVLGEPTQKKGNDKGMIASYSTILTNSHIYILLEKDEKGQLLITTYSDDNLQAVAYRKKLGMNIWF